MDRRTTRASHKRTALDAATGSGQAALALAAALTDIRITALDASAAQVEAARGALAAGPAAAARVTLLHAPAEDTGLPSGSFDLVLCAQALHWMDVSAFYAEAARLLVPGGAVVVLSYAWPSILGRPAATAALLAAANGPPLGPLWDKGRALVDAGLPGLDPPHALFEGVERWEERHAMRTATDAAGVGGYVRSWSAHAAWRKGRKAEGEADPADVVEAAVGGGEVTLEWPVLALAGRKKAKM